MQDEIPAPLVSAAWLMKNRNDPGIRIIDATWTASFMTPHKTALDMYEACHIPASNWFDIDQVCAPDSDLPHMLPTPSMFGAMVGELGISSDDYLIVADSHRFLASARVWWMFRTMGHDRVSVLDGGVQAWQEAGGEIESGASANHKNHRNFRAKATPQRHVKLDQMRKIVQTGAAQIVDARSAPRFDGLAPEPREGLRSGHMPGAINLPVNQLLTDKGTLKSETELREAFENAGVILDRPIVTTCGSGVTAGILSLALAQVGRTDVPLYDGSWAEWASTDHCPIQTVTTK